jgi:TRAP-type C4-dicarboxylate transport system permease small subunit
MKVESKKGVVDHVIDFMAGLAGLLLVAAVLIVCFEIVMRYFFRKPQVWSVEVCEYILFTLAFLGAPWLLKKGGHVSVDVVTETLSSRARAYLGVFACGIGVLISAVITWFSIKAAWNSYVIGEVVTKTLTVGKHYFLLFITLGYFFLMLEFGRQFLNHLRAPKEGN